MENLISKSKNDDIESFTELMHCIQNDLYRVAQTRLQNNDDISDAIQETIIIVYKKIKKLKEDSKFKSWVIKILINECNLIYKKSKRQKNIYEKIKCTQISTYEEESLYNANSTIDFSLLINQLNYEERLIITLYYNSLYSCDEISEILNMNPNTVRSKLTRAKIKIKNIWDGGSLYE